MQRSWIPFICALALGCATNSSSGDGESTLEDSTAGTDGGSDDSVGSGTDGDASGDSTTSDSTENSGSSSDAETGSVELPPHVMFSIPVEGDCVDLDGPVECYDGGDLQEVTVVCYEPTIVGDPEVVKPGDVVCADGLGVWGTFDGPLTGELRALGVFMGFDGLAGTGFDVAGLETDFSATTAEFAAPTAAQVSGGFFVDNEFVPAIPGELECLDDFGFDGCDRDGTVVGLRLRPMAERSAKLAGDSNPTQAPSDLPEITLEIITELQLDTAIDELPGSHRSKIVPRTKVVREGDLKEGDEVVDSFGGGTLQFPKFYVIKVKD